MKVVYSLYAIWLALAIGWLVNLGQVLWRASSFNLVDMPTVFVLKVIAILLFPLGLPLSFF